MNELVADVIVVGEALWDVFPARAFESLRTRRREVRHPGGAPANVARVLARLGVASAFVGALGIDALGDGLVDALADDGVDVTHVARVRARTGVTFVDLRSDGTCAFLPYRSPSADQLLEPAHVPPLRCSWLHLGSSSFARAPAREAALRAVEIAREQGARVSLDLNVYPHLWSEPVLDRLPAADLLKASDDDLRALGLPLGTEGARALHAHRPDRITIVTHGADGLIALDGAREIVLRGRRRRVVDPTGAGDAFTAGVLASLVHGATLDRALRVGAELGARVVGRLGATAGLGDLRPLRRTLAGARSRR